MLPAMGGIHSRNDREKELSMHNQSERTARARSLGLLSCSLVALALVLPSGAQAQDTDAGGEAEAIIVTGSRIARSTFDTPSPVTVVGGEEFEKRAVVNLGAGIAELPAFRPSTTPATQGFGSFNVGAQIVNLRGIGVTRNLILVDGRRFAPTTREGSVDLNLVPAILVSRTEVVTGGASAAYGSDALAGAVNILLDKTLEGFKVQADYGVSNEGDGDDRHLAGAFGTRIGDRGHIVIGGEYDNQKGIGNCFARDWCTPGAVLTNGGYNANGGVGNGRPNYVRSDTDGGWFFNSAGVISGANNTTAATAAIRNMLGTGGITFGSDGTPVAYHPGSFASGLSQIGGDLYPTYTDANISVPVERYSMFGHADIDLFGSVKGFAEASFGHVDGTLQQTAYFSNAIPIKLENPFIPASVRALIPSTAVAGSTVFSLGRVLDDVGRGLSISTADTYRATTGLSGDLGANWQWDLYYQYGHTDRLQTVQNNLIVGFGGASTRFAWAVDAIKDPANPNNIVCRALTDPSAAVRAAATGCVPINLFGSGNVTQQGKDFIFGTLTEDIALSQHVAAANLRGDVVELWAGPLSAALGGEYRVDKIKVVHDALSNQNSYFQNFGSDYDGTTKVTEGYIEAELPLAKDASFAKSLSLNGALRLTHYDITGFGSYLRTNAHSTFDATAWKGSVVWDLGSGIRLRATQSRDIRAPNFAELFLSSASAFTPVANPYTGTNSTPTILNGGTPTLRPEKADTTTLGLVVSPEGALNGLRVSVDWYRIKVKDYIGAVPGGAQFIANRCFAGVQAACAAIDFGPGNATITQVRNVTLNLDFIKTQGIDIEAVYRIPLGGSDRSISLRGLATYVSELKTASFGDVVDRAGQTGNSAGLAAPSWTASGFVTFDSPHVSATLQGRFIDKGVYDGQRIGPEQPNYATTLLNSIDNNSVASRFYLNLFGSYRLSGTSGRGPEVFAAINNLLNTAPPAAPETQFYTNPVYFDTVGRYYRVGLRYKY
jgi:outer membrane receptor protein involved in Fe transport